MSSPGVFCSCGCPVCHRLPAPAFLRDPPPFCEHCPDHEACSQGAPCAIVKAANQRPLS